MANGKNLLSFVDLPHSPVNIPSAAYAPIRQIAVLKGPILCSLDFSVPDKPSFGGRYRSAAHLLTLK